MSDLLVKTVDEAVGSDEQVRLNVDALVTLLTRLDPAPIVSTVTASALAMDIAGLDGCIDMVGGHLKAGSADTLRAEYLPRLKATSAILRVTIVEIERVIKRFEKLGA